MAPSLLKKSRISSRDSFWVLAPCRQKNPSRHWTGLVSLSRTVITITLPTVSTRIFIGGSQFLAISWISARNLLLSLTPTTFPSSQTPRRIFPPELLAKAARSLAREEEH